MTARSAIRVLRDAEARQAALRRQAEKYDYHAEVEQYLVGGGYYDYAQIAHDNAVRVLRAWRMDIDDPEVIQ